MTVNRAFPIYDIVKTFIGRVITSDHVRDAYKGIAYLYEAIGNEAPPGSGAQVVAGHDHSTTGAYITRGCCASQFGGRAPLFSTVPLADWGSIGVAFPSPSRNIIGSSSIDQLGCHIVVYASPGVDSQDEGVFLEFRMRIYWAKGAGCNMRLRFECPDVVPLQPWTKTPGMASVEIDVEARDELQELIFHLPCKGDFWNRVNIYVRAQGDAPFSQAIEIWDYQIHETQLVSQPKSRGVTRFV